MWQRMMGKFTHHPPPGSIVAVESTVPSSGPRSAAGVGGDKQGEKLQAANRRNRTARGAAFRQFAQAVGFLRPRTAKTGPDPLTGLTDEQRSRLRTAATAVLCNEALLAHILGRWPFLSEDGSYTQDYLSNEAASLSQTSKAIRKAMLPVLAAALLYCHYNRVFVYTSSIPQGWLKFKGTDRLAFGRWVTEQVVPRRLHGYASVLAPELRAGFMKDVLIPATQAAFHEYVRRNDLITAKRMLTSGLISPFDSFDGVKPLFLLVPKVDARYLDEVIEGIHELKCFTHFINASDERAPRRRLLDYALERGNQAVIDVLRKHGAVTHDIVVEEQPPARLIVRSESSDWSSQ